MIGYYCPNGTIANDQYPCAPGTYSDRTDLKNADECDACPKGHYCQWGTGNFSSANPPLPCLPGYYCPPMTPSPDRFPCPAGTYSDRSDLAAADECTPCPPSKYCEGERGDGLFIYIFNLFIYLYIYWFFYLFIHFFIYSFLYLFISLFIHFFIYSFIHLILFINLFTSSFIVYLFIHLFLYLFIYSFIFIVNRWIH